MLNYIKLIYIFLICYFTFLYSFNLFYIFPEDYILLYRGYIFCMENLSFHIRRRAFVRKFYILKEY